MQTIIDHPLLTLFVTGLLFISLSILLSRFYWKSRLLSLSHELEHHKDQEATKDNKLSAIETELRQTIEGWTETKLQLGQAQSAKEHLALKMKEQKAELQDLHTSLRDQFEVMANQILEQKTAKFTQVNEQQIKGLIEPLGKDIKAFQAKVEAEVKERFSLGERVKELSTLNSHMLQTTENLTKALKGESKTQGRWGEVILERILEKSGLRKNEQYFMEHQLEDKDGQALRSTHEGKKMRPDALIKYPDERNVIVDAKVSLTAFARALETDEPDAHQIAIQQHLTSIKAHIKSLSEKAYDDYDKSLDFVLMFVPSEPAYIAAMQADPELWSYAYDKRVLLQSPTNLITSLKLIEELWKREAHNQNAQAIAERGAKLFDKFVGFVENLEDVGAHLDKAKSKYDDGFKQLTSGRGNLIRQAEQLKGMIGKTKKELPKKPTN